MAGINFESRPFHISMQVIGLALSGQRIEMNTKGKKRPLEIYDTNFKLDFLSEKT